MAPSAPPVSVIIPARDAGRHLRPAVLSALDSGVPGVEVVVADDGTTDGSVRALADLPVRVVPAEGRGEAAARNAGVAAARAPALTFLDADDLLTPDGLAPRLRALDETPGALAVGGLPGRFIDGDGGVLAEVSERMAARLSFPFELTSAYYRSGAFFPVSCSLFVYRREAFELLGRFDAALAAAHDADILYRILAAAPVPVLRLAAFDRRLHPANFSMAGTARTLAFRPAIRAAIEAVNARHGVPNGDLAPWEREYL